MCSGLAGCSIAKTNADAGSGRESGRALITERTEPAPHPLPPHVLQANVSVKDRAAVPRIQEQRKLGAMLR